MSAYKFRLQKLLDIREEREEKSKINFKKANMEKMRIEEELLNAKQNLKKHRTLNANETLIERKIKFQYINALNSDIERITAELEDKTKVLEQKRCELKKCQVERKTVEILKEKKTLAYNKEQARIEQNTNDEIALYGFIRNKSIERR